MSKKNKIIMGISILFLLGFVGIYKCSLSSEYKISIINDTNKTIEKLEVKYKVGNIIQNISQIKSKKTWNCTVNTDNIQGENSIVLIHKDKKGNSYEEYIIGYLEKGYSGKTEVVINSIDKNGKLGIIVK